MNRYPNWVNWLVLIVIVVGCIVALPNVFGDDPGIHIARDDGQPVVETLPAQVTATLRASEIGFVDASVSDGAVVVRFADVSEQLRANDLLNETFETHRVALTLAPRVPAWLAWTGLQPMNLGLDLRGGVHFLFQVDLEASINQFLESWENTLRTEFRSSRGID